MTIYEVRTGYTSRLVEADDELEAVWVVLTGNRPHLLYVEPVSAERAAEWLAHHADGAIAGRASTRTMTALRRLADENGEYRRTRPDDD